MRKDDEMTEEEYSVLSKKYYVLNDLKAPEDFTEDEKKLMVEDCTVKFLGRVIFLVFFKVSCYN